MKIEEKPIAGYILSLTAGVLILVGSGMMMFWVSGSSPYWGGMIGGMMNRWQGMMSGWQAMMRSTGIGTWFWGISLLGFVSGIVVILGAFMLYSQPRQAATWGSLILIFSLLSFLGMGGFFIGAVLGLVGGLLAVTWRSSEPSS